MRQDPFEREMHKLRSQLDLINPPKDVWTKISAHTIGTKSLGRTNLVWKSAAIILLGMTIGLSILLLKGDPAPHSLSDISQEYKQIETDYQREIHDLSARLMINEINQEEFEWIFDELAMLDKIQSQYLRDLAKGGHREKVIGVLIDQYEKKLNLLKKLELELNRQQNENTTI
jgi:hypothetical protein